MDSNKSKVYEIVKNHFSLDKESLHKFKELLEKPFIDPVYKKILGNSLRKEYDITKSTYEEIDKGWCDLKTRLPNLIKRFNLTYKNFRTNKIIIDKQEIKICKHFADYYQTHKEELKTDVNIGNQCSFEQRLSYLHSKICECQDRKIPKGENVKIVLSVDFSDWFLCSTAESWGSCISLESHYEGAMWSGLPGLIGDPNRAMLYITDGKKKCYQGIEVDKLISRSFTLISNKDEICVVRFYPNQHFNIETINAITKIGLLNYFPENFISKHKIIPLYHKNNCSSFTYQDFVSADDDFYLKSIGGGHFYFEKNKSGVRTDGAIFSYEGGLSELIAEKQEINNAENSYIHCDTCGDEIDRNDAFYPPGEGYPLCDDCFSENYFICSDCEETYSNNDCHSVNNDGDYCPDCFNKYFKTCYNCGAIFDKKHTDKYLIIDDITYCKKCFKEKFPEKLEEIFSKKNKKAG
jgi:hypothetical protein